MKIGYLAFGLLLATVARGDDQFINWRTDYQGALQEAKQTQKPVFLEFRCEA
jgi:hypothetical protein